ncbi:hypothetical protein OESDEN_16218 [Oesophagostomum dentatum]|uniref:Uncharacterized protein n=1 Tax=Oesophagostomum dentatum TaxID=61180 RepID=A0A0B1SKP4_OESDE|nr:hypothetical protein OESDEN_16218 [Oesophagostomum dentatum]
MPLKRTKLNSSDGEVNVFADMIKTKTPNGTHTKKGVKRKKVVNGEIVEVESELDEDEQENEEESENSELSDEDEEVSDDSVLYVDDDESDEEAYVGEDREATVLQTTNGDAITMLPDFDKFPFSNEDSSVTATRAFAWMVAPCDVQTFFKRVHSVNSVNLRCSMCNYTILFVRLHNMGDEES